MLFEVHLQGWQGLLPAVRRGASRGERKRPRLTYILLEGEGRAQPHCHIAKDLPLSP